MAAGIGKCGKIRHIVRLRQLLRRWRQKAALTSHRVSSGGKIPTDVPSGHVAITVGDSCRRFIVRATYLNHPVFKKLLVQAEEEYGFINHGPLTIPCDELVFEEILRLMSRSDNSSNTNRFFNLEDCQRSCHSRMMRSNHLDFWPESKPLLSGPMEKSIWPVMRLTRL